MQNKGCLFFILVIVLAVIALLLQQCKEPPVVIPTPTPTKAVVETTEVIIDPTATLQPTKTLVPTDEPTATPTVVEPTKTPKPLETVYVEVYTAWKFGLEEYPGWLHFRGGPGIEFYPVWKYGENYKVIGGWLPEGTVLEFLQCVPSNEWANVIYESMEGFVRAEYILPRLCSK